jgi:hypothetical protein
VRAPALVGGGRCGVEGSRLGPLQVEQKKRAAKQRSKLEKNKSEEQKPQEVREEDIQRSENETTKNVIMVRDLFL